MKYVTFVAGAISLKHLSPLGTGTLSGGHWTGVREVKKLSREVNKLKKQKHEGKDEVLALLEETS